MDSIDEDASGKMVAYYWCSQAQDARDALEAAQAAAAIAQARIEELRAELESVLAITRVGGIDGASLRLNVRATVRTALNKGK
jgi:hypothetical protein